MGFGSDDGIANGSDGDMSTRSDDGMSTLLIGLDGACPRVLERLFADGAVPTLQGLFEGGVWSELESQVPPWTPSAWPTLYTGTNPGKHGIFGFLHFDGYEWDVVNATHVRERPLWLYASDAGLSSVVVNVPVTEPPDEFDGALVPGYVGSEAPRCHPEGLLDDVRDATGEYRVYSEGGLDGRDPGEAYKQFVRTRGAAFRYLASRFEPAFGFVEFQQTDTVFHEHPDEWAVVREVYRAVDQQIDAIIADQDPDTVFVVSDHGIGPYEGPEFRANEFLKDEGFLETTVTDSGMPSWVSIREGRLRGRDDESDSSLTVLERLLTLVARTGLTTQHAAAILRRVGLADHVGRLVPDELHRAGTEQVDFRRSRAYVRDRIELGVRINLAGREPDGVVPPEEYDAVRAELIDALDSVTTPDGTPVFEDVAPREAYFQGPAIEDAVDVVTVPAAFDQYLSAQLYGAQFGEPTQPWNHKRHGIFAAAGSGIDGDADLSEPHILDVAPTVLSALGIPRSDRMDGEPLPVVDPSPERSYPSYESRRRQPTENPAVEKQLADLGYM